MLWRRQAQPLQYDHDALLYPFRGFIYVLTSPSILGIVCCVALLGIAVSLAVTIFLFVWAWKPHAETFGGGKWWSRVLATITVLLESILVTAIVMRLVQSKIRKKIFVETMVVENRWRPDTMIEPSMAKDFCCCFRWSFYIKMLTLPLNLIPVFGTVAFILINAPLEAWEYMDMYFDALQMDSKAQFYEVSEGSNSRMALYRSSYARFGLSSCLLEVIPIVGPAVFSLTNACAAALWACDMEAHGGPFMFRDNSTGGGTFAVLA